MKRITAITNEGESKIYIPQNWDETSVAQYQDIIGKWNREDWIDLFSILSGLHAEAVAQSKDGKLEMTLYESIEFVYKPFEWSKLPVPKTLELRPIWQKDCPLIPIEVAIPKKFENLSIGQAIQARKALEGMKDTREGIARVTAICLQPIIDNGKFNMIRVKEIEEIILKMSITKIYPVGFFLLRKLNKNGKRRLPFWSQILRFLRTKGTKN